MAREFLSPEGLRLDGRRANEVRRLACELGVFDHADGSALFELGNTRVCAAVRGPREPARRAEAAHDRAVLRVEVARAAFSASERKEPSSRDRQSTELAALVQRTLERVIVTHLFPRSQIELLLHVLHNDGGLKAAAINAATLALIDAGVPLKGFTCACSAGVIDGALVLDLNQLESGSSGGAELTVAADPKTDRVGMLLMEARMAMEQLDPVMQLALAGCREVCRVMTARVKAHALAMRKG